MLRKNILRLRTEREISQLVAAEICSLPRTTYRDLEQGRVKNPTLSQICRLCRGFNVTPNDLIPKEYWKKIK